MIFLWLTIFLSTLSVQVGDLTHREKILISLVASAAQFVLIINYVRNTFFLVINWSKPNRAQNMKHGPSLCEILVAC